MAAYMEDLPEHLLLDIFSLVPASDLISNCRLVCSQWRDLVDQPVLWKRKFKKRDQDSSPKPLAFYILSRLEKNLIKNPDGQDGLDSWEIQTPAEGHWETEELPTEDAKILQGEFYPFDMGICGAGDEGAPVQVYKCFAARNGPCSKSQLITLKDEGYWDELMDEARPTILVKDTFSSGPGSRYKLTVKLLSADSEVLKEHENEAAGLASWFSVSHIFNNYPQGVRHILFEHEGHKEAYCSSFLFPEQGPNEDGEPSWVGMRVLKSSITLQPPPTAEMDDDDYDYDYDYNYDYDYDSHYYNDDYDDDGEYSYHYGYNGYNYSYNYY